MTDQISEPDSNCVMLTDSFVHVRWTAEEVTEKNAATVRKQIASLNEGTVYPLLIELRGVRRVKLRIEKFFAAAPLPVTALAIVASSPVDWATGYFYVSKVPSACATRLFTSLPKAEAWLKSHPRFLRNRATSQTELHVEP